MNKKVKSTQKKNVKRGKSASKSVKRKSSKKATKSRRTKTHSWQPHQFRKGWVQLSPINLSDLAELNEKPKTKDLILELTSTIKQLLYKNPRYRDNDRLLCTRVQKDELRKQKINPKNISTSEFFKLREDHKVTCEDTITRLRRKCQQEYPNTRGKKYKKRQNKALRVQEDMEGMKRGMRNYSRRK